MRLISAALLCVLAWPAQAQSFDFSRPLSLFNEVMEAAQGQAPSKRTGAATDVRLSPDEILDVQQLLNSLGYDAGPADGVIGRRTRSALEAFERDAGLPVTGEITQERHQQLAAALAQRGAAGPTELRPGPSYDCAGARSVVEVAICRSAELSSLDLLLAQAYSAAVRGASDTEAAAIRQAQRDWLDVRNDCRSSIPCLQDAMLVRLGEIGGADSPASVGQSGPLEAGRPGSDEDTRFDEVPYIGYAPLLRLYLHDNGDTLTTPAMAVEAMAVFAISPEDREACNALDGLRNDSFARDRVLATAMPILANIQTELRDQALPRRFRFTTEARLQNYDASIAAFPIELRNAIDAFSTSRRDIFVARSAAIPHASNPGRVLPFCDFEFDAFRGAGRETLPNPSRFSPIFGIDFEGLEFMSQYPMPREQAESLWAQRDGNRKVLMDFVVEIPSAAINYRSELRDSGVGPGDVLATVVAARLLDADTRELIHDFGSRAIAAPAPALSPPATEMPVTPPWASWHRLALLMIQDGHDPIPPRQLNQLVELQIEAERTTWNRMKDDLAHPEREVPRGLDPTNPFMFFDWQTAVRERPDLAGGPLLHLFVDTRSGWDFVRSEPTFDSRFRYWLRAFVFDRESWLDRDISFAANELAPVYRQLLSEAAPLVPRRLRMAASLDLGDYDFATSTFSVRQPEMLRTTTLDNGTPPADRRLYNYDLDGEDGKTAGAAFSINPADDLRSVHAWQSRFYASIPSVSFAFDRRLVLPVLPMAPEQAERLRAEMRNAGGGVRLVLEVEIESTEIVSPGIPSDGGEALAYTRLVEASLVDARTGNRIASLPAETFPLEADLAAAEATAARQEQEEATLEAQQAQEAAAAAEQQAAAHAATEAAAAEQGIRQDAIRPAEPFGPELLGLRLGMSLAEAEAIVRERLPIVAVAEQEDIEGRKGFFIIRVFMTEGGRDQIALYSHEMLEGRLLAVSRRSDLSAPVPAKDELRNILFAQRGAPTLDYQTSLFWTDTTEGLPRECFELFDAFPSDTYAYVEGQLDSLSYGDPNATNAANRVLYLLEDLNRADNGGEPARSCPTTFAVRLETSYIRQALFDGAWVSEVARQYLLEPAGTALQEAEALFAP